MGSGITDFGGPAWLSALLGITAAIENYQVALAADQPGADSDGTILAELEPAGGGYVRRVYYAGDTYWGLNGPYVTTLQDIDFGVAATDWGRLTHYALCTAPSEGDIYAYGQFLNPIFVTAGDPVLIPAGGIVLALANLVDSIAI